MDAERAKEIMSSPSQILVTLEGKAVWIDEVDDSRGQAKVHDIESGDRHEIACARLHES